MSPLVLKSMLKILSTQKNKETAIALGFVGGMILVTILDVVFVTSALLRIFASVPIKQDGSTAEGTDIPQAIKLMKAIPETQPVGTVSATPK